MANPPQGQAATPATPPAPAAPVSVIGDATSGIVITRGVIERGFLLCADPAAWAAAFTAAAQRFPAFNREGWACILAKAATEAGGLTRWDENLYYTSVAQVALMHGMRAVTGGAAEDAMPAYRAAIQAARKAKRPDPVAPEAIAREITPLLRNPKALGDRVYAALGGYDGRGLGVIQLTGLANQQAFADAMGMTLAQARAYMQTIEGAAMTAPWYLDHYGATARANAGDMKAVLAVVAGKTVDGLSDIWASIHGDQQVADFQLFRRLLA